MTAILLISASLVATAAAQTASLQCSNWMSLAMGWSANGTATVINAPGSGIQFQMMMALLQQNNMPFLGPVQAQVHQQACSESQGGQVWRNITALPEGVVTNELWAGPGIQMNGTGGDNQTSMPWSSSSQLISGAMFEQQRSLLKSVVLHDLSTGERPRRACCDLMAIEQSTQASTQASTQSQQSTSSVFNGTATGSTVVTLTSAGSGTTGITNPGTPVIPITQCLEQSCCAKFQTSNSPCTQCLAAGCQFFPQGNTCNVRSPIGNNTNSGQGQPVVIVEQCPDYCSARKCADCINTPNSACVWCHQGYAYNVDSGSCQRTSCSTGLTVITDKNRCGSPASTRSLSVAAVLAVFVAAVWNNSKKTLL